MQEGMEYTYRVTVQQGLGAVGCTAKVGAQQVQESLGAMGMGCSGVHRQGLGAAGNGVQLQ